MYFEKVVELAKKAGDNVMLTKGVFCLSECCVKTGRIAEAIDLYKSVCDEIGKGSTCMDPDDILRFAETLEDHHETSQALTILEDH